MVGGATSMHEAYHSGTEAGLWPGGRRPGTRARASRRCQALEVVDQRDELAWGACGLGHAPGRLAAGGDTDGQVPAFFVVALEALASAALTVFQPALLGLALSGPSWRDLTQGLVVEDHEDVARLDAEGLHDAVALSGRLDHAGKRRSLAGAGEKRAAQLGVVTDVAGLVERDRVDEHRDVGRGVADDRVLEHVVDVADPAEDRERDPLARELGAE